MPRLPLLLPAAAVAFWAGAAAASDLTIANWNIQTLIHPADTVTVFPDDYRRTAADFADLRRWRDLVGADVYLLQEVTSPAAIDAVFPAAEGWSHCISGQYAEKEGLAVAPVCVKPGENAPVPHAAERAQFTAIAIRPGAPVTLDAIADVKDLNVGSLDDGEVRPVRWGLDVTLKAGPRTIRALIVHMKSGCFDDRIFDREFLENPAGKDPSGSSCATLGRQLFPLRQWIEARAQAGEAWLIAGDFNRRLDAGGGTFQDEMWEALSGYRPRPNDQGAIADIDERADVELFRLPYKVASACWIEFLNARPGSLAEADGYFMMPIEFFLFGRALEPAVAGERQVTWPWPEAQDPERLSDHCPAALRLELGQRLSPRDLKRIVFVNDGFRIAVEVFGRHDRVPAIAFEERDADHQRPGEVEGDGPREFEIVGHCAAPAIRRGPIPRADDARGAPGRAAITCKAARFA